MKQSLISVASKRRTFAPVSRLQVLDLQNVNQQLNKSKELVITTQLAKIERITLNHDNFAAILGAVRTKDQNLG